MKQILIVAAFLLFSFSGAAHADRRHVDYLRQNAQRFEPEAPTIRLDRHFRDGRLFLLGEVHGIADNQKIDLALLKHLHRVAGVRTYMGEFDFAQADVFNRFLDTGDPWEVELVFDLWRNRRLQWANREYRAKLDEIRTWNDSLPMHQRIRFYGADEVQNLMLACRMLRGALVGRGAADSARTLLELVRSLQDCVEPGRLAAAAHAVRANDRRALGEPASSMIEALAVEAREEDREARIAANARRYFADNRSKPAYGMWGLFHVVQAQINGTSPMALLLVRSGVPVRSVESLNLASEMMMPMQSEGGVTYAAVPYTVDSEDAALIDGIEDVKAAAIAPVTLWRLDRRSSPYLRSSALTKVGGRFGRMQPFEIDAATAPSGIWVQYLILAKGSRATTPWPERARRAPLH
jgi:hypothetical protein